MPALEQLVTVTDATANLALAESVHALVQGDDERASAVQHAAAFGHAPPPEVRSILTPNSGMTITYRLVLLPQEDRQRTAIWHTEYSQPARAKLEAWVSAISAHPTRYV